MFLVVVAFGAKAQNVGIGTVTPEESAVLDLNATDKGFLLPRLTEKQKVLIPLPAEGLMIYQTDSNQGVYLFQGGNWRSLGTANTNTINGQNTALAVTAYTPNYLLTSDANGSAVSSGVYVNPSNGNMGIGISFPSYKLEVRGGSISYESADVYSTNRAFSWSTYVDSNNGNFAYYGAGNDRLVIARNGNVGIGISSPQYRADIRGGSISYESSDVFSSNRAFSWSTYVDSNNGNFAYFGDGNNRLVLTRNGNLGIGVNNPQYRVDIRGGTIAHESLDMFSTNRNFSWSTYVDENSGDFAFYGAGNNRFVISRNGNVGIGVFSPQYRADIRGGSISYESSDVFSGNRQFSWSTYVDDTNGSFSFYNNGDKFVLSKNGNIGIGIKNPSESLEVNGSIKQSAVSNSILKSDAAGKLIGATPGTDYVTSSSSTLGSIAKFTASGTVANSSISELAITNGSGVKVDSKSAGYLAIGDFGSSSPMSIPTGYRLVVQDGIITEKVKVALRSSQTDWADYVFSPEYNLLPLSKVEEFIKENKHLPNVPSADQMVEIGVDVAKTSKMFMEKIEELTLYLIDLKKEIEILKQDNSQLKNKK